MTEKTSLTLAARLLAVMGEVPYIQKGGKTQSGPSFRYVRHDDVVGLVRPALVKHGVGFMAGIDEDSVHCEQIGVTKSGAARYKTTLILRLTFVNIDNPEEAYSVSSPGEGVDTDDKGSGKALSYALKNGLLKTFMIEAGDEADNEAATQDAAPRPQAIQHDQQREQAATAQQQAEPAGPPAPSGCITQTQARQLHENLLSKGRESVWFLGVLASKGIGDGKHLTSIPSDEYERMLHIVTGFADPPPPEPTTPAAAPTPAETDPTTDQAQAPVASQEPAVEVAAPAATSTILEPEVAPESPPVSADDGDGFAEFDAELDKAAAAKEKTQTEKTKRKATVTSAQLTRLGALCASIEANGVGNAEWRTYMETEEGVRSRTQLTKAAATRMIDRLHRWSIDLQSGVVGPAEGVTA